MKTYRVIEIEVERTLAESASWLACRGLMGTPEVEFEGETWRLVEVMCPAEGDSPCFRFRLRRVAVAARA